MVKVANMNKEKMDNSYDLPFLFSLPYLNGGSEKIVPLPFVGHLKKTGYGIEASKSDLKTLEKSCLRDEISCLRAQIIALKAERVSFNKNLTKLRKDSLYDQLTNLPNRRLFTNSFHQSIQSGGRANTYSALLFFDLDKFKSINDTYGHAIGDRLLMEFARRLKKSIRGTDTLARLGGDEFVALLKNLHQDKNEATKRVEELANKILLDVSRSLNIKVNGVIYNLSPLCRVSIGVKLFLTNVQNEKKYLDKVIALADEAMFHAKSSGGNQVQIN